MITVGSPAPTYIGTVNVCICYLSYNWVKKAFFRSQGFSLLLGWVAAYSVSLDPSIGRTREKMIKGGAW